MRSRDEAIAVSAAALGCVLLLGACAGADPADSCAVDPGDAARVVSAGSLPDIPDEAEFSELWRVGGVTEGEHFAVPLPVAISREGRAAIADFALGELIVIEADGTWRGSLARRGMGPGELSSPVAAVWDDDGGLHVYDLAKPAIVRFADDLTYIGEDRSDSEAAAAVYASGGLDWAGIQPSGATVLMPGLSPISTEQGIEVVLRVSTADAVADTLRSAVMPVTRPPDYDDRALPGYSRVAASVGAGGRLAVIGGERGWLVDVHDDDGAVLLRLCAEPPAQPLTPIERGRGAEDRHRTLAAAFADAVPPQNPARHGRVVMGADGTIWVQRERPSSYPDHMRHYGDPGTTFDVFSPHGRHLRTLRLPPSARLQGALGDTIWTYEIGDLEDVSVVAYAIGSD